MSKLVARIAKLEFVGGQAKPGPTLASLGISMQVFVHKFNDGTKDRIGKPVPVKVTIYEDKTFALEFKTTPAAFLLKEAAKIKSGSANSKTTIAGKITKTQLDEIAKYKLKDLNTNELSVARKIIAGTAKNMGILIEGIDNIELAEKSAKLALEAVKRAKLKEEALLAAEKEAKDDKDKPIEVNAIKQDAKELEEEKEQNEQK